MCRSKADGGHRCTGTRNTRGSVRATVDPTSIPDAVTGMLADLRAAGLRPRLVGGWVRDALLGLPNKDYDVEVYGGSLSEASAAIVAPVRLDNVGATFGVTKAVLADGSEVDVSVPAGTTRPGPGTPGSPWTSTRT